MSENQDRHSQTTLWRDGFLAAIRGDDDMPDAAPEWREGYAEGGRVTCAIADGNFEEMEDAPPVGRTPQREAKAILADYGDQPDAE